MFETTTLDQPVSAPNKNMATKQAPLRSFFPKEITSSFGGWLQPSLFARCRGRGGGIIIDSSEIHRLEPENQPLDKEKTSEANLHFQVLNANFRGCIKHE